MATYLTTTSELTAVADAIRAKANTQSSLVFPSGFVSTISAIPTGSAVAEVAAATYSANQGTKIALTLSSMSGNYAGYEEAYDDMDQSGYGALSQYLANNTPYYMMVADSSGNVFWKGEVIEFSSTGDPSNMMTAYCGGQCACEKSTTQNMGWDDETQMETMYYSYVN